MLPIAPEYTLFIAPLHLVAVGDCQRFGVLSDRIAGIIGCFRKHFSLVKSLLTIIGFRDIFRLHDYRSADLPNDTKSSTGNLGRGRDTLRQTGALQSIAGTTMIRNIVGGEESTEDSYITYTI